LFKQKKIIALFVVARFFKQFIFDKRNNRFFFFYSNQFHQTRTFSWQDGLSTSEFAAKFVGVM